MARIVALYPAPQDPAAFDTYYETKHVELAQKMPGLRSIELSKGPVMSPTGGTYHRVGTLRPAGQQAVPGRSLQLPPLPGARTRPAAEFTRRRRAREIGVR